MSASTWPFLRVCMCVCMCFQAGTGTGVIRKGEGGSLGHRLTEGDIWEEVGGQRDEQQYQETGARGRGRREVRGEGQRDKKRISRQEQRRDRRNAETVREMKRACDPSEMREPGVEKARSLVHCALSPPPSRSLSSSSLFFFFCLTLSPNSLSPPPPLSFLHRGFKPSMPM